MRNLFDEMVRRFLSLKLPVDQYFLSPAAAALPTGRRCLTRAGDLDVAVIVETADDGVEDRVIDIAFDIDLAFDVYLSPRVIRAVVLEDPVWRLTGFVQAVEREGMPL